MGNSYAVYDRRCLTFDFAETKFCAVFREHVTSVRYLEAVARALEGLVYEGGGVGTVGDGGRVSWYQLIGQLMKKGEALPIEDPYRSIIVSAGKAEKLIGQMENEFTMGCNSQLLRPVQEIRTYCQTKVNLLHSTFLQRHKEIEELNVKLSNLDVTSSEYCQLLSLLKQKHLAYGELHEELHRDVIYVYEAMVNLKTKLPGMIEHQLEFNMYSASYLEYVLYGFKENKIIKSQMIPLKKYKENIGLYIPDFRRTLQNKTLSTEFTDKVLTPLRSNIEIMQAKSKNVEKEQFIESQKSKRKNKAVVCGGKNKAKEQQSYEQVYADQYPNVEKEMSDYKEKKEVYQSKINTVSEKQPYTVPKISKSKNLRCKGSKKLKEPPTTTSADVNEFGLNEYNSNLEVQQKDDKNSEIFKKQKNCVYTKKEKHARTKSEELLKDINKKFTETNMSLTLQTIDKPKNVPY